MSEQVVSQAFVGLLYEDGAFKQVLQPGKHKLKKGLFDQVERTVTLIDMRERSLTIKGQEILTADKVAIRVSLLVYFKVIDPEAAAHNVAKYEERIYEDVQLSARRFLASRKLEAILSDRNEISDAVRQSVKASAAGYGVEIVRADVKDLVFPGNLREIMNRVLETERRAEAQLIETERQAEAQVIQARKQGEALRIKAKAETDAARLRLEAEKEQVQLRAQAEIEATRFRLEADKEQTQLRVQAELEAARLRFEAEKDQARLRGEANRERRRLRLESDKEEAAAMAESPQLLKLRELETLRDMSSKGAKFLVGLKSTGGLGGLLRDDEA